jgi:hypothetical protein
LASTFENPSPKRELDITKSLAGGGVGRGTRFPPVNTS